MEYNIDTFTEMIMTYLRDNVPFENPELSKSKHPKRDGKQLRDLFDPSKATITRNIDMRMFEVGGPMAETLMPHYHILQNSEVIRKRGRGTTTTKGSQAKVKPMERDYERVNWNGKTFSKEYTKNVRGSRSKAAKILEPKLRYINGRYVEDLRGVSNSYVNTNYQYIDRILDATMPYLASEFNMRIMRKVDTGLEEEYNLQQQEELNERFEILDIFDSFNE